MLYKKRGVEWKRSGGSVEATPTKMSDTDAHAALRIALATPGLNSKDLGGIGETWYRARHLEGKGKHYEQVRVKQGAHGSWGDEAGTDLPSKDRDFDFVGEDGVIREVKSGNESVKDAQTSNSGKSQFEEYRELIGKEVEVKTGPRTTKEIEVKELRYVFLTPEGGAANAAWLWDRVAADDHVAMDVFVEGGVVRPLDRRTLQSLKRHGWSQETFATHIESGEPEWPQKK